MEFRSFGKLLVNPHLLKQLVRAESDIIKVMSARKLQELSIIPTSMLMMPPSKLVDMQQFYADLIGSSTAVGSYQNMVENWQLYQAAKLCGRMNSRDRRALAMKRTAGMI